MELPTTPPAPKRLHPAERVVAGLDTGLGAVLCLLAAVLYALSAGDQASVNDPHGGAFGVLGAFLMAPSGLLFLLAGHAVRRRWRFRWAIQVLPIAAPLVLLEFPMVLMRFVGMALGADQP